MSELTPEQKAALEEQKKNCPFCKLVAGEFPSHRVYENEVLIAVLDIRPAREGHVLVIPKEHYFIPAMMPPDVFKKFYSSLGDIAAAMKKALLVKNVVEYSALGGGAGQQVPHMCVHLIPEWTLSEPKKQLDDDRKRDLVKKTENVLNAMLQKNLSALGYTSGASTQPSQAFTKEQVIEIIDQNPDLKKLIEEKPEDFRKLVASNDQLKILFEQVSVDEIIQHYAPKTSLDDIAGLFK
ncbi:HIT domain-containing protein [Candidatus Woesearchaeota archaeon]|nr:MAG: HIT domain-containing protein [Candidatus Woesearchaeota archaeon]